MRQNSRFAEEQLEQQRELEYYARMSKQHSSGNGGEQRQMTVAHSSSGVGNGGRHPRVHSMNNSNRSGSTSNGNSFHTTQNWDVRVASNTDEEYFGSAL